MSLAASAAARALIAKITWDLGLPAYTDPPDAAEHPFVVVQSVAAEDVSTAGEDGQLLTAVLHVWSDYPGAKEALDILGQLYNTLHRQQLVLSNHAFGGCFVVSTDTYADPDGQIHHGIMTLRIYATG